MMRPAAFTIAVVALALAMTSCATLDREEVAAPLQGGAVAMRTNTALVVSLPPDPDNGYGWVLRSSSPNLALIGGPDYTPAPKPPGLVGAADTTAYRFRATATGSAALEFVWTAPPGQPPVTPERVVRYDVTIGPTLALATDYFGTMGMQSARQAGNSTMGTPMVTPAAAPAMPAAGTSAPAGAPAAPSGGSAPGSVKYWSF